MRTKTGLLASVLALACLLFAGSALAAPVTMGVNGSSLTAFMGNAPYATYTGSLAGSYNVTALFTETANTIHLDTAAGASLFNNRNTATWGTKTVDNLAGTSFVISSHPTVGMTNPSQVHIFSLTQDYTYQGKVLPLGTLIIGLEDTPNNSGGYDYNDFILSATPNAPTPVPPAVWLLGSGLLGVMGFKRTRQNAA